MISPALPKLHDNLMCIYTLIFETPTRNHCAKHPNKRKIKPECIEWNRESWAAQSSSCKQAKHPPPQPWEDQPTEPSEVETRSRRREIRTLSFFHFQKRILVHQPLLALAFRCNGAAMEAASPPLCWEPGKDFGWPEFSNEQNRAGIGRSRGHRGARCRSKMGNYRTWGRWELGYWIWTWSRKDGVILQVRIWPTDCGLHLSGFLGIALWLLFPALFFLPYLFGAPTPNFFVRVVVALGSHFWYLFCSLGIFNIGWSPILQSSASIAIRNILTSKFTQLFSISKDF